MIQELEEKSLVEDKRTSANNVNIENLTMNMSMNHKTVVGLQEDRKYRRQACDEQNFYCLFINCRFGFILTFFSLFIIVSDILIDKEIIDRHT